MQRSILTVLVGITDALGGYATVNVEQYMRDEGTLLSSSCVFRNSTALRPSFFTRVRYAFADSDYTPHASPKNVLASAMIAQIFEYWRPCTGHW